MSGSQSKLWRRTIANFGDDLTGQAAGSRRKRATLLDPASSSWPPSRISARSSRRRRRTLVRRQPWFRPSRSCNARLASAAGSSATWRARSRSFALSSAFSQNYDGFLKRDEVRLNRFWIPKFNVITVTSHLKNVKTTSTTTDRRQPR